MWNVIIHKANVNSKSNLVINMIGWIEAQITDTYGRTVRTFTGEAPLIKELDARELSAGVYHVKVWSSQNNFTERFVVK